MNKTKLKDFAELCEIGCTISEICSSLGLNSDELSTLAQVAGFDNYASFYDYHHAKKVEWLIDKLTQSANKGDKQARNFLKKYSPPRNLRIN